jgi:hypothetical protein
MTIAENSVKRMSGRWRRIGLGQERPYLAIMRRWCVAALLALAAPPAAAQVTIDPVVVGGISIDEVTIDPVFPQPPVEPPPLDPEEAERYWVVTVPTWVPFFPLSGAPPPETPPGPPVTPQPTFTTGPTSFTTGPTSFTTGPVTF